MAKREFIARMRSESTFFLVVLSLATLGIYGAHYIRKKTKILNQHVSADRISKSLINAILALAYANVILTLLYAFYMGPWMFHVLRGLYSITGILAIVWALNARHIMHARLSAKPGDTHWFNGVLTLLLTFYYFNYKVNKMENHYATREAFDLP